MKQSAWHALRGIDPRDWSDRFNTDLSVENEERFQAWLANTTARYGTDLRGDLRAYDLRGFWLNGGHTDEAFRQRRGHAPDTYKKPNHPTFSDESIYNGADSGGGERFEGGRWLDETTFRPSAHMLRKTHKLKWYLDHMRQFGDGVRLDLEEGESK